MTGVSGDGPTREQEIRQRLAYRTQGEWSYCGCGHCGLVWSIEADFIVASASIADKYDSGPTKEGRIANAEFIANAPADLAYLLGEVAQLREQLAKQEGR